MAPHRRKKGDFTPIEPKYQDTIWDQPYTIQNRIVASILGLFISFGGFLVPQDETFLRLLLLCSGLISALAFYLDTSHVKHMLDKPVAALVVLTLFYKSHHKNGTLFDLWALRWLFAAITSYCLHTQVQNIPKQRNGLLHILTHMAFRFFVSWFLFDCFPEMQYHSIVDISYWVIFFIFFNLRTHDFFLSLPKSVRFFCGYLLTSLLLIITYSITAMFYVDVYLQHHTL